jgi:hypothetical protein
VNGGLPQLTVTGDTKGSDRAQSRQLDDEKFYLKPVLEVRSQDFAGGTANGDGPKIHRKISFFFPYRGRRCHTI